MQEDIFPQEVGDDRQIEQKVAILYLVEKMDMPVSRAQIAEFAADAGIMNYYTVTQYLTEMVEAGYLERGGDDDAERFLLTDEGAAAADVFIKRLPQAVKQAAQQYVSENGVKLKKDLEVVANHFYNADINEYTVKCGAYEDDVMLMELNLSVVSKEQALSVCRNWRSNIAQIYGAVVKLMLEKEGEEDATVEL